MNLVFAFFLRDLSNQLQNWLKLVKDTLELPLALMKPKFYLVYWSKLTSTFSQIVYILHTRQGNRGNQMKMNFKFFPITSMNITRSQSSKTMKLNGSFVQFPYILLQLWSIKRQKWAIYSRFYIVLRKNGCHLVQLNKKLINLISKIVAHNGIPVFFFLFFF